MNWPYSGMSGSNSTPALVLPLMIRQGEPGDRFDPLGLAGRSQPLNDFFRGVGWPARIDARCRSSAIKAGSSGSSATGSRTGSGSPTRPAGAGPAVRARSRSSMRARFSRLTVRSGRRTIPTPHRDAPPLTSRRYPTPQSQRHDDGRRIDGRGREPSRAGGRAASWWTLVLAVALGLRVIAAFAVTRYAEAKGKPCVFGDTVIYGSWPARSRRATPTSSCSGARPISPCGRPAIRCSWPPAGLPSARTCSRSGWSRRSWGRWPSGWWPGWRNRSCRGEAPHPPPSPREEREAEGIMDPRAAGDGPRCSRRRWRRSTLTSSGCRPWCSREATLLPLMLLGLWGLAMLWRDPTPGRSGLLAVGTGWRWGWPSCPGRPGRCSCRSAWPAGRSARAGGCVSARGKGR